MDVPDTAIHRLLDLDKSLRVLPTSYYERPDTQVLGRRIRMSAQAVYAHSYAIN